MANSINATSTSNGGLITTGDDSGVLNIQTNETTAISIDASQNATFTNGANLPNTFGFKNRLINGGMVIDQRNAGAEVNPAVGGTYYTDRWFAVAVAGKYKIGQNAGGLTGTDLPAGFTNYLGATSLSAYSVGASDTNSINQSIEGLNVADLGWGTANAASVTISFWVRSSLTGTFGGVVRNSTPDRTYVFSYTISAANTWEQKSVTIAGDTSGTWLTTNGIGLRLTFSIGSGTTVSNTAGSWYSGSYTGVTGGTSVVGTSGATFYITGVQLEKGTQATSFDFRSYGTELALCQRYYEQYIINSATGGDCVMQGVSTTSGQCGIPLKVTKRSAPTVTKIGGTINMQGSGTPASASLTASWSSVEAGSIQMTSGASTTTNGGACTIYTATANTGFAFSSEL